jgi:hypothetical protein
MQLVRGGLGWPEGSCEGLAARGCSMVGLDGGSPSVQLRLRAWRRRNKFPSEPWHLKRVGRRDIVTYRVASEEIDT